MIPNQTKPCPLHGGLTQPLSCLQDDKLYQINNSSSFCDRPFKNDHTTRISPVPTDITFISVMFAGDHWIFHRWRCRITSRKPNLLTSILRRWQQLAEMYRVHTRAPICGGRPGHICHKIILTRRPVELGRTPVLQRCHYCIRSLIRRWLKPRDM